jgi:rhodanese-related sulfurtransferase
VAQPAPPAPQIAAPSAPAAAPQPAPARPPPKRYASAAEAAEACEPGSASIFYEDFKKPEPDWLGLGQLTNGNAYFDGGQLVIKATADADRMVGRAAALFRNASLCVRVVAPPAQANPGDGGGGIVFWATSPANGYADRAYAVMIDPTGRYSIARSADNSIYDLVKEEPFAAIKSGLGAVNLIKVAARTTGNSVWINGNRAYDFAGQREADNQFIGFIASSEQNQVDEWRFLDMVVVSPNFANELTDYRVAPQTALQVDNVGSATPTSIPGARTIRTGDLYEAYLKTTLDGAHFVLIDALTDTHAQTIAGAQRMDYAGEGNSFTDDVQVRLEKDLKAAAKNDLATPLVFFCEGAQSWESYNAALRAEKIGFTNVYWYRGGIFAWQHAGLPMK